MSNTDLTLGFTPDDQEEPLAVRCSIDGFSLHDLTSSAASPEQPPPPGYENDHRYRRSKRGGLDIISVGVTEENAQEEAEWADRVWAEEQSSPSWTKYRPNALARHSTAVTRLAGLQPPKRLSADVLIAAQEAEEQWTPTPSSTPTGPMKALNFNLKRQQLETNTAARNSSCSNDDDDELTSEGSGEEKAPFETCVDFEAASMIYVHSPRFIAEITTFADEIREVSRGCMSPDAREVSEKKSGYLKPDHGPTSSELLLLLFLLYLIYAFCRLQALRLRTKTRRLF